ncbi:PAS domain-containing protein [Vibrio sp. TH_r3]|uniref:helix-turn-helix transcriptional regulator n=1 Tax=Vibrio sp. TH_r3 TaxID=3082084 RepID=UPI002954434B|nr:PAS domain-containing protein [Vibrio sp. TH_r3]MDV7105858.1 PAS domain-containing protein [Vibrio sp. TH_r3]
MNNNLQLFKNIASFLAQQMQDCEFVIHDLSNLERSIVFIGNGHISGRTVGDSATDLVLRVLKDKEFLTKDYTDIYKSVSSTGKAFNSSTFFIKDNNELVGLLCINQDLTNYQNMFDALGGILRTSNPARPAAVSERLVPSVSSLPTNVIEEVFNKKVSNVTRLTKEERMEVIKELDKKGIFLLKGSISEVAKTLKVSDATMYRYLQKIK